MIVAFSAAATWLLISIALRQDIRIGTAGHMLIAGIVIRLGARQLWARQVGGWLTVAAAIMAAIMMLANALH